MVTEEEEDIVVEAEVAVWEDATTAVNKGTSPENALTRVTKVTLSVINVGVGVISNLTVPRF